MTERGWMPRGLGERERQRHKDRERLRQTDRETETDRQTQTVVGPLATEAHWQVFEPSYPPHFPYFPYWLRTYHAEVNE